jgi:hypothetical protein
MVNYQGSTGQDPTALTAGRSPNYAIIRHCSVYRNWGIGLSTYESSHTIMEDNISYDNYSNNIYISDATDVLFQRNLVYSTGFMDTYGGTPQTGIAVGREIQSRLPKNNYSQQSCTAQNIVCVAFGPLSHDRNESGFDC